MVIEKMTQDGLESELKDSEENSDFDKVISEIKEKIAGYFKVYLKISIPDLIKKIKLKGYILKYNKLEFWKNYCEDEISDFDIIIGMLEEMIIDGEIYGYIDEGFLYREP